LVIEAHMNPPDCPGARITDGESAGSTLTGIPLTIVTPLTTVVDDEGTGEGAATTLVVGLGDDEATGAGAVALELGRGALVSVGVAVTVARLV
jgi:hypothetical protein